MMERFAFLSCCVCVIVTSCNRYFESLGDCDQALILDSSLWKLHIRKGKALLRLGDFSKAADALSRVLEYFPFPGQTISASEFEAAKNEARTILRNVNSAKQSWHQISVSESKEDFNAVLTASTDLLAICPAFRQLQVFHSRAYCKLKMFEDGKNFIESLIFSHHESVLCAQSDAFAGFAETYPLPASGSLKIVGKGSGLSMDSNAFARACLWLGSGLARSYLCCIKNSTAIRTNSSDVMDAIILFLTVLRRLFAADSMPTQSPWAWVPSELSRIQEMTNLKKKADKLFRSGNFDSASMEYLRAVQVYLLDEKY